MSNEDKRFKYKTKTTKPGQRARMKGRGWVEVTGSNTSTGERGKKGDVYSGPKVKTTTTYKKLRRNQKPPKGGTPLVY